MKAARAALPSTRGYLSTGPLVWVATMVCTTLLLVALRQALWLVVPFLLAIILYYALFPAVRRMTLAGVERETAAAFVSGGSLVIAIAAMVPTLPWLAAQAVSGQEALFRYLAGGRSLVERSLSMLESQFGFLKELDFHAEMSRKMSGFRRHLREGAPRRRAARDGRVASRAAAGAVPRVLLPARRPEIPALPGGRRAERLLRAHALHDRPRRRHRARLLPGPAQAHDDRHDLPRARTRGDRHARAPSRSA